MAMDRKADRAGEMVVFVHVVQAGGFARAGRELGLSPSAVSKLISRLERRLGASLLRRSTRRLSLTVEGERFHGRAVAILAEIEAAEREAGGASRPAGRVRVNSSASYVTHVLAPRLPEFLDAYPEVGVDVVQTDLVTDLIAEGTDIAVRAGPLADSGLVARSLGSTRFIVVAAPEWIARNGVPGSIEALGRGDLVGLACRRVAGSWLPPRESPSEPLERVRASDGEGVRRLVLAGVGPARMAEFTVRSDVEAGRLVHILKDRLPPADEPFHAVYAGPWGSLPARARVLLDFLAVRGRVD